MALNVSHRHSAHLCIFYFWRLTELCFGSFFQNGSFAVDSLFIVAPIGGRGGTFGPCFKICNLLAGEERAGCCNCLLMSCDC